jgi:hypothetical protein
MEKLSDEPAELVRSVRRLTRAVWCLIIVSGLVLTGVLYFGLLPLALIGFNAFSSTHSGSSSSDYAKFAGFGEWSIERRVRESAMVVRADHSIESGRLIVRVAEVLRSATTKQHRFAVGLETTDSGRLVESGADYGEGQIMFIVDVGSGLVPIRTEIYRQGRLADGTSLGQVRELSRSAN